MKDKIVTFLVFAFIVAACIAGCLWDKIRFPTTGTASGDIQKLEKRIEKLESYHGEER